MTDGYCLAHGLITLHLRTESAERHLPVALYEHWTGQDALRQAGARVRRVARWDASGRATWWEVLACLAGGRPAVVALPDDGSIEVDHAFPIAYSIPPAVAVRAATSLDTGTALYIGAFACEVAAFGPQGMDEPHAFRPGLETLYRAVIAEIFGQERRALLPVEVPALLAAGRPVDVSGLLAEIAPHLAADPVVLGGEDEAVVSAVATALREAGHETATADALAGMERLVWAVGGVR